MSEPSATAEAIHASLHTLSHLLHDARVDYRDLLLARRRARNEERAFTAADVQKLIERARHRRHGGA